MKSVNVMMKIPRAITEFEEKAYFDSMVGTDVFYENVGVGTVQSVEKRDDGFYWGHILFQDDDSANKILQPDPISFSMEAKHG
jgi:hypothetical protein